MLSFSTAQWLLFRWLLLRWLLLGWLFLRWLLIGWLFLRWLLLTFNLNKTPLEEIRCFNNPYFFTYWLPKHSVFWFTPSSVQSVGQPLITYPSLCSTCMTYRTPCHSIGHQVLPTQPLLREVEDFPRGGKHSKHVPLLTCLAWLQPVINNLRLTFKHVKIKNGLLVVKSLIKMQ